MRIDFSTKIDLLAQIDFLGEMDFLTKIYLLAEFTFQLKLTKRPKYSSRLDGWILRLFGQKIFLGTSRFHGANKLFGCNILSSRLIGSY